MSISFHNREQGLLDGSVGLSTQTCSTPSNSTRASVPDLRGANRFPGHDCRCNIQSDGCTSDCVATAGRLSSIYADRYTPDRAIDTSGWRPANNIQATEQRRTSSRQNNHNGDLHPMSLHESFQGTAADSPYSPNTSSDSSMTDFTAVSESADLKTSSFNTSSCFISSNECHYGIDIIRKMERLEMMNNDLCSSLLRKDDIIQGMLIAASSTSADKTSAVHSGGSFSSNLCPYSSADMNRSAMKDMNVPSLHLSSSAALTEPAKNSQDDIQQMPAGEFLLEHDNIMLRLENDTLKEQLEQLRVEFAKEKEAQKAYKQTVKNELSALSSVVQALSRAENGRDLEIKKVLSEKDAAIKEKEDALAKLRSLRIEMRKMDDFLLTLANVENISYDLSNGNSLHKWVHRVCDVPVDPLESAWADPNTHSLFNAAPIPNREPVRVHSSNSINDNSQLKSRPSYSTPQRGCVSDSTFLTPIREKVRGCDVQYDDMELDSYDAAEAAIISQIEALDEVLRMYRDRHVNSKSELL